MSKKTGSGRRFMIAKNLIMMLATLAAILVAIFAWYTNNSTVTAEGTTISAKSAENVELALPEHVEVNSQLVESFPIKNKSWSTSISFNNSGFLKDLVKDVTSGGKQFVVPNFQAASGLQEGRKVIADDVWVEGLSSQQALKNEVVNDDDQYNYISLDFYLRSKTKDISVIADSFLAAGSEKGIDDSGEVTKDADDNITSVRSLIGSNVYRPSTYGDVNGNSAFSSDAIVGAMRVSLECAPVDGTTTDSSTHVTTETTYNGESEWSDASALKFVWLPRPDLYLLTDNDSSNWRLYTGIKPSGNDAKGSLTAADVDTLAKQEIYCHSFFEGNYINNTVPKGLTYHKYWDKANYNDQEPAPTWLDGENSFAATNPDIFKVSVTKNDEDLGKVGHYPTLGQSVRVADNALEDSKSITFLSAEDNRETEGYYVYKCKLNIWIEGEDAEARRSMNNGMFTLELDFGT